ncbi:MAG: hypothetical protein HYR73_03145 [Candidatus Eisenbacteria bacterium]|nr:hypothetical protein [Candidatus Eisenbacteria bacterium]
MRRWAAFAAGIGGLTLGVAAACCDPAPPSLELRGSQLAYPLVSGEQRPDLVLAQRTIERRWGPSDDSTYREVSVPGWKSEGGALAMSALVPGTGQLYCGARSGYLFLIGEAIGIYQTVHLLHKANQLEKEARAYAGSPLDSTSRFAFDTYEKRGGQDVADLQAIYYADPSLFFYLIARDERYRIGWLDYGYEEIMREQFIEDRDNVEQRRKRSRVFRSALWANHLVAAFDAMRAARLVNLPLRQSLDLRMKAGWRQGSPTVTAVLERKF